MLHAWVVPAAMFGVMFGMGLTLGFDDFRRIARVPGATLLGTFLQLVGMPVVGLALAHAFALPPTLAAGLVIAAACPGGVLSNVLCHLGRADAALSVTLTATATTVTLFTIPLWVRTVSGGGAEPAALAMPVLETARTLAAFTLVPVALGMVARSGAPRVAAHERAITQWATVIMIAALAGEAVTDDSPPVAALAATWRPALLLLVAALVLGLGVPWLLAYQWRDAATIAVELCIKNTVLGLFVATQSLGSLEAAVPVAAVMTLQLPFGLAVLAIYSAQRRRGLA